GRALDLVLALYDLGHVQTRTRDGAPPPRAHGAPRPLSRPPCLDYPAFGGPSCIVGAPGFGRASAPRSSVSPSPPRSWPPRPRGGPSIPPLAARSPSASTRSRRPSILTRPRPR